MSDYIFNVALGLIPLVAFLIPVYIALYFVLLKLLKILYSKHSEEGRTNGIKEAKKIYVYGCSGMLLILAMIEVTSPSITYKHTTYDVHSEAHMLRSQTSSEFVGPLELEDKTLKTKHTSEEREDRLDDMIDWRNK